MLFFWFVILRIQFCAPFKLYSYFKEFHPNHGIKNLEFTSSAIALSVAPIKRLKLQDGDNGYDSTTTMGPITLDKVIVKQL